MTTALLVIDPQCDFCDGPAGGALAVPGAWDDMNRLADHIRLNGDRLDAIIVTLDSHSFYDIAHPVFWTGPDGRQPPPLTIIGQADVATGRWCPADPAQLSWVRRYLAELDRRGRFAHTIWPPHCLIGSSGHRVHPGLFEALNDWQTKRLRPVEWIVKGINARVEHYSALKTEVSDPQSPDDQVQADRLIRRLRMFKRIEIAGEALSHCVRTTIEDLLAALVAVGEPNPACRLTVLSTMTSSIAAIPGGPDFPALSRAFLSDLRAKGAEIR